MSSDKFYSLRHLNRKIFQTGQIHKVSPNLIVYCACQNEDLNSMVVEAMTKGFNFPIFK